MAGKAKQEPRELPNAMIRNDLMRLLSECVSFLHRGMIRRAAEIAVARAPKEKCPKISIDDLRAAAPGMFAKAAAEWERAFRQKDQIHVHRNAS